MPNNDNVSLNLLCAAVYSADYGIVIVDADENILVWNDWIEKHSGINRTSVLDKTLTQVFSLDESSKVKRAVVSALEQGKSTLLSQSFNPHQLPLYRKVGQGVLMTQRVIVRSKTVDEKRYCILEIIDQSAGAEREKFLAQTKKNISQVIDSIQDMLIIFDSQFVISEVNGVVVKTLGFEENDLVGQHISRIISTENNHSSNFIEQCKMKKVVKDHSIEFVTAASNTIECIVSGAQINKQGDDSAHFVAIAKDISDFRRAQEQVVAQKAQLAAASKLSALGEMAGGVAHEINNPVAIIHGLAYRLQKVLKKSELPEDSEAYGIISEIDQTTTRITKIIKGLKAFSRSGDQDDFLAVKLISIIDETLALCAESFRRYGIKLEVSEVPDTLYLECRQVQISQVLLNLLNNAKDAISELEDRWIKIDIRHNDEKVWISVEDSGSGIPESVVEKLFQPFFTTKSAGKGTGLGLSISQGLIEDHRGRFFYDANSSNTRFVIILPKWQREHRRQNIS